MYKAKNVTLPCLSDMYNLWYNKYMNYAIRIIINALFPFLGIPDTSLYNVESKQNFYADLFVWTQTAEFVLFESANNMNVKTKVGRGDGQDSGNFCVYHTVLRMEINIVYKIWDWWIRFVGNCDKARRIRRRLEKSHFTLVSNFVVMVVTKGNCYPRKGIRASANNLHLYTQNKKLRESDEQNNEVCRFTQILKRKFISGLQKNGRRQTMPWFRNKA